MKLESLVGYAQDKRLFLYLDFELKHKSGLLIRGADANLVLDLSAGPTTERGCL
jgi:hypothetical protein